VAWKLLAHEHGAKPVKVPNSPEWMTVADVAEMLRFSRKRIYRMIQQDQLPAYRFPGGDYRIRRRDLEEWIEGRKLVKEVK
jgi:excisionase family DNA binding protein